MTVSATPPYVAYAGAGTSGPFAVPFRFLANADLAILKTDAAGVETALTGSTISGAGDDDGGQIYTAAAVAVGETLRIYRATTRTQTAQYVANGPFPAATHERALDKAMLVDQEQDRDLGRAVLAPLGEVGSVLPKAAARRGLLAMFADTALAPMVAGAIGDLGGQILTAFGINFGQQADASDARGVLDVYSKAESYTRALAVNEAPNANCDVVPELSLVRALTIGVDGKPTGQRPAMTCTNITTGTSTPTLTFSATLVGKVSVGELIQAPVTAHANLRSCPLEVLTISTNTATVKLSTHKTGSGSVPSASDANGDWTVVTRGDDVGVTGDLMSGNDYGRYLKNGQTKVWLTEDPNLLALVPGATAGWIVEKGLASDEGIAFYPNQQGLNEWAGTKRAFCWSVAALDNGAQAVAIIYDGGVGYTGSSVVGGATPTVGSVSHARVLTSRVLDLTAFSVTLRGSIGQRFFICNPQMRRGEVPKPEEFSHRLGWVRPQGSVTIDNMNGAAVTLPAGADANGHYSHEINLYQEGGRRFSKRVRSIFWNLEGIGFVKGQILATKEGVGTPITYGHVVTSLGATLGCTIQSNWVDADGAGPGVGIVTATVTTEEPHGLITGQSVIHTGAQQAGFDGTFIVTVTGDTTYTYTFTSATNPFGSNPGTVTTATALKARFGYYSASRCDLNLRDGKFYLYSVWPSQNWRSVSMDVNRILT